LSQILIIEFLVIRRVIMTFICPRCKGEEGIEYPPNKIGPSEWELCILCNGGKVISREQAVSILLAKGHKRLAKKIGNGWPSNNYDGGKINIDGRCYGFLSRKKRLPININI
jgi:hypothetical protein